MLSIVILHLWRYIKRHVTPLVVFSGLVRLEEEKQDELHLQLKSHTGFTGLHLPQALFCQCRNRMITVRGDTGRHGKQTPD